MTNIVSVLGRKGGTGKTVLSHLLAHGVMDLGGYSVMMMTDVRTKRPPEFIDTRKYMIAGVEQGGDLVKAMSAPLSFIENVKNSVMVIDGGSNRRNIDFVICELSDLILIPTGTSIEELEVAEADYFELVDHFAKSGKEKDIFVVLNKWPGETRKKRVVESKTKVKQFLHRWDKMGILFPDVFPYIQSLSDMADGTDPKYTFAIDKRARDFARLITNRMGLDIERDKAEELRLELENEQISQSSATTDDVGDVLGVQSRDPVVGHVDNGHYQEMMRKTA